MMRMTISLSVPSHRTSGVVHSIFVQERGSLAAVEFEPFGIEFRAMLPSPPPPPALAIYHHRKNNGHVAVFSFPGTQLPPKSTSAASCSGVGQFILSTCERRWPDNQTRLLKLLTPTYDKIFTIRLSQVPIFSFHNIWATSRIDTATAPKPI